MNRGRDVRAKVLVGIALLTIGCSNPEYAKQEYFRGRQLAIVAMGEKTARLTCLVFGHGMIANLVAIRFGELKLREP